MVEENISQEFRLNKIRWNKKLFPWSNNAKWMMNKKHKKVCITLNYIEYFLILASTITGCISVFAFTPLLSILMRVTSFAIGLKISAITAAVIKYKWIIKKKRKKLNKIVLLATSKLNSMEVLISNALIDSNISHEKFVLINNVLKEYDDMKKIKIKI